MPPSHIRDSRTKIAYRRRWQTSVSSGYTVPVRLRDWGTSAYLWTSQQYQSRSLMSTFW